MGLLGKLAVPTDLSRSLRTQSERTASPTPSNRSSVSRAEAEKNPEAYLRRKAKEFTPTVTRCTPSRSHADVDDSSRHSPWSKKTILSLDGGGVKGYSSLLILKYFVSLIEDIENGERPYLKNANEVRSYQGTATSWVSGSHDSNTPQAYDYRVVDSQDCPWNPSDLGPHKTSLDRLDSDKDLRAHVDCVIDQPQVSNIRLHHYFDYAAGTSTGGLSAIMLGRMEMSVEDALKQYDVFGNSVFGKPRPLHPQVGLFNLIQPKYPSNNMRRALVEVIAKALRQELSIFTSIQGHEPTKQEQEERIRRKAKEAIFQSDENRCRTMIVSYGPTDDETEVTRAYLFRTYNHGNPAGAKKFSKQKHLNPGKAHRDPIWKVARATSAAPPYFSPIEIRRRDFKDGAIIANNPAKLALAEVEQMHDARPHLLLTVGTGRGVKMENYRKKYRSYKPRGYLRHWWREADLIKKILTESQKTAEDVEDECSGSDGRSEIHHYRLNVLEGLGTVKLDAWQPHTSGKSTKKIIKNFTKAYLAQKEVHSELLSCAQQLVRLRRDRAMTERWETFASKYFYVCQHLDCRSVKGGKTYATRNDLRDHLTYRHQIIVTVGVEIMDDNVKTFPKLNYVCTFDNCARGFYAFTNKEGYRVHLNHAHQLTRPIFFTITEMEALLNCGRITEAKAYEDYIIPAAKAEQAPPATPPEAATSSTTAILSHTDSVITSQSRGQDRASTPASVGSPDRAQGLEKQNAVNNADADSQRAASQAASSQKRSIWRRCTDAYQEFARGE